MVETIPTRPPVVKVEVVKVEVGPIPMSIRAMAVEAELAVEPEQIPLSILGMDPAAVMPAADKVAQAPRPTRLSIPAREAAEMAMVVDHPGVEQIR